MLSYFYTTASILLICLLFIIRGFAQDKPKTNLRSFINSGRSEQALTQGGGFYVEPGESQIPDDLRFSTIELIEGLAISSDGAEVIIEGRYDREALAIQVLYLNKIVNLDGTFFPYVRLGSQTLAYVHVAKEGVSVEKGYAVLTVGTFADRFRGYTTYRISQTDNSSINRGIVPPTTNNQVRIDSSYLIGGLADMEVELPRKEKWLLPLLDSCTLGVMKRLQMRYKANSFEVLREVVDRMNEICR